MLERLNELGPGYELQSLLDPNPSPSINLDYFSVEISQMPNDPNTGEVYTQKQFFDYFRKNINNFVYAGNSQFDPLTSNDGYIWESNDPTGAAISIDIDVIPFTGIGDDGTVICSQAEENFWIFSTLTAPSAISSGQSPFALSWPDGFHPVSGNRQSGYFTNSAGNMEIYTRGVDRFFPLTQNEDSWAGYLVGYLVENTAFGGADDLWESLQERITSFVNNSPQNGIANIIDPVKLRPPTGDALLTLLKQSEPITSIPCQ